MEFFKVVQGGGVRQSVFPYLSDQHRRIPLTEQSDYGLYCLYYDAQIDGVEIPAELKKAALLEWHRRYGFKNDLTRKGWAIVMDEEVRKRVYEARFVEVNFKNLTTGASDTRYHIEYPNGAVRMASPTEQPAGEPGEEYAFTATLSLSGHAVRSETGNGTASCREWKFFTPEAQPMPFHPVFEYEDE